MREEKKIYIYKNPYFFVVAIIFYYQNDLEFARKWHVKKLVYSITTKNVMYVCVCVISKEEKKT